MCPGPGDKPKTNKQKLGHQTAIFHHFGNFQLIFVFYKMIHYSLKKFDLQLICRFSGVL